MFGALAPSIRLTQSLDELLGHLPGVRDGAEESIHDARVGIRRVREALSLANSAFKEDELGAIEERLSLAAKALSRARDADVGYRLVENVEIRFPLAPAALGHLRAAVRAEQVTSRRKAVKKLEALDLESLPRQLERAAREDVSRSVARTAWRGALRDQMVRRAAEVRVSIERASGLYFPNRVHSARVTIKQLRYTLELADRTGIWRAPRALRLLRKVQDALGGAHDGQVLLARLDALRAGDAMVDREEVDALDQFIQADILARHAKYVAWRPDILAVCDACTSAARASSSSGRRMLLAAGVALPSLLLLKSLRISTPLAAPPARRRLSTRVPSSG